MPRSPIPSVALATLGCKVAQYETEALRELFLADGFSLADADADFLVVNTCTVTKEADRKCRQAIRRLGKRHPRAKILLIGCYAQAHPEEAAALPQVYYVGGTADKCAVVTVARQAHESGEVCAAPRLAVCPLDGLGYEPMQVSGAPRTRAYVKICDGCDCFCTYCAIPAARGPIRSRPPQDILAEVERLIAGGTYEVVLTGIETASYGRDFASRYRLIDLLEEVCALPVGLVRLGSLTPEVVHGDFAERLARLDNLAPHFHLSVQSGSSEVLARMKRRYNAEGAMRAITSLRTHIPAVRFTCDMIVGFPCESKENFAETMAFSEKADFLSMHVFPYSKREGTPAAAYPDEVGDAERAARAERLSALAARMTARHLEAAVAAGVPLTFLVETVKGGLATGHAPNFLPLAAPAGRTRAGERVMLLPKEVRGGAVFGEIIK